MTWFLICAGLLLIAVLALVLFPLLRPMPQNSGVESSALSLDILREQLDELERRAADGDRAEYEVECAEIERRALEDGGAIAQPVVQASAGPHKGLAAAVAVAVCAVSVGLYLLLGQPAALAPESAPVAGGQQAAHAVTPQQLMGMVAKLSERLQENPNDAEGWLMLARSYTALGRYPEASAAFGRASALIPDNAQLLSDYADTLAMAQGRSLFGEPEKLIQRALAADPRNLKALALSGSVAFGRGNYADAITQWRKILAIVPAGSNVAAGINNSIADAESRLKGMPEASRPTGHVAASVGGVVSLDTGLRQTVSDTDTVFIFARAPSGPRMPLAVMRATVRDLPQRFELNDGMGMPNGPRLSSVKQVVIGARVSRTGSATPQPGDLEGYSSIVDLGAKDVNVAISGRVQ